MKRTLGGDRIGSGAGMDVELHGYGTSTHSLTTTIKTTMGFGTLLPIHNSIILAGDKRKLNVDAMLMTHPTNGPLFDTAKLQVDVFSADMRLYIAKLHMNLLGTGMDMSAIKLPLIKMTADKIDWTKDPSNQQINPSSIFRYLHISGLGDTVDATIPTRYFNAIAWLIYWDVYKNYYANKQEKKGAVIHTGTAINETIQTVQIQTGGGNVGIVQAPATASYDISGNDSILITCTLPKPELSQIIFKTTEGDRTLDELFIQTGETETTWAGQELTQNWEIINWRYAGSSDIITILPRVQLFDLSLLDDIKMDILSDLKSTGAYIIDETTPAPFGLALGKTGNIYAKMQSQEGLAVKTYQNDLFQTYLNAERIDDINTRSRVSTDGGSFTMDSFLLAEKMFDYLNRIAVAGGTVDDMMEVTYDVRNKTRSEIPVFEGGMSKELIFEQVISNSASADQPLGTIAGRGKTSGHKGGTIRISNDDVQHKYYIVIASLTPRITYTQGNNWDVNLKTYDDLHKPAFDQIGYQDLITDQMVYWDTKVTNTGATTFKSVGKQLAWTNYQTEIDRAFGNFAIQSSEGWMIFDRNYQWDEDNKTILDLTTYIDPALYNGVFSYRARDAQNIWAQFKVEDIATRKMSANQMPRI